MKKLMIAALVMLLAVGALVALAENNTKETPQDIATDVAETESVTIDGTEVDGVSEEDEMPEVFMLGGEITEVGEGYFVMTDAELGEVQVNLGDDSAFDGVEVDELTVGQYVYVIYDGKMTRSLPPQVFALRVSMYATTGEITELSEGKMTLVRDEIGDEVIISLPQDAPELAVGDHVTAYTTGIMTLSIPAQMNAVKIVK